MVDEEMAVCFGIIVSVNVIEDIENKLIKNDKITEDEEEVINEFIDNYTRCINTWTGEDYFIGIYHSLRDSNIIPISNFSSIFTNKETTNFKEFFDKYKLWDLINWKPELMLINFCY
jgi:hypothetical protein